MLSRFFRDDSQSVAFPTDNDFARSRGVKKLRMAVIGAGRLGGFHAQKISQRNDVELVAVADPLASNRDRVATDCHTKAYADYHELLGHIDAAVVATPTKFHHKVALELLEAGVHVLVEKPICTTHAEADELVAVAKRRNLVLQVGHVERFNPAFNAAMPHVNDPKFIETVRTSGFTFRSTDVGVVLDMMIHDIDLVLSLVHGKVCKVDAIGVSVLGGHEDVANVRLEFDTGCVAILSASRVSYEQVRKMQIWSSKAFAGIDFATRTTTLVRPSETLLQRQFDVDALNAEQVAYYRDHLTEEHLPREQLQSAAVDALALEDADFVESVCEHRSPRVNGEAGRNALAIAERILDRIQSHAWDARQDGRSGPMALPAHQNSIPAPHFPPITGVPAPQRKAG
jgi:predicted dehydrogenase